MGGGGYSGFQLTGLMDGFFRGCKIFVFRIFLDRKILASIFFGYSKLMFLFFVLHHVMLSGNFYDWRFGMEFFRG